MTAEAVISEQSSVNSRLTFREWLARAMPRVKDFFVHVLGQVRILKKVYPGIMHFMIFWGVTIQVLGTIINILQMKLFLPWTINTFPRNGWYLGYELVMDIAGAMILLGVLMAAIRRYIWRPKYLETRWDDTVALVLLFLIAFVGFTNEGIRLMVTNPAWRAWSPVGNWAASIMAATGFPVQEAAAAHDALVSIHVILALTLVALMPFTKMRHLVNTPLNILVRPRRKTGELTKIENIETTEKLGVGKVTEFAPQQLLSFDACVGCGRCEEACPANFSGMPYSPRNLIQRLRKTMVGGLVTGEMKPDAEIMGDAMPDEYPWYCTTCGACLEKCPAFVNPVDEVIDLRRYQLLTSGKMPKSVGDTMRNLERQGNPWGMPPENRMAWAEGLNVRQLAPGQETDVLFFTGCAAAFDDRNKKVARAFVKLMQKAGVDFAVLGFDETCCGETARRMGHEYIFQEFAKQNIETFGKVKFNRIVTACPHCFNTLKNEYPQMGGDYKVQHYSEFLAELALPALAVKLPPALNRVNGKLAYHDSCYLGRYNGIYAAPRRMLDGSGVERVEMARQGEDSFCCGGGGGGMWLETDANTRINHRRLKDALDAKAGVVATACPYCTLMFDDAIRSKGISEQIKVMDIAEVITAQLEIKEAYMETQRMLKTLGDPLGAVHRFIGNVWQDAGLDALIVPPNGGKQLRILDNPAALAKVNPFLPLMKLNLSRWLPEVLDERPATRLGVLLRPCEMRALEALTRRGNIPSGRLLTICLDCLGTFPQDEFAWRVARKGSEKGMTKEALQFAPQGGISVYRYRAACQMCPSPAADAADVNISVLGLPVRQAVLVGARDRSLAGRIGLMKNTDAVADANLVARHEKVLAQLAERHMRTRERVIGGLMEVLPADVDALLGQFEKCGDCQACMDACPICAASYPRRMEGRYDREDVAGWLASCAGCGMCEQACPQHLPLSIIFTHVKQKLAETLENAA